MPAIEWTDAVYEHVIEMRKDGKTYDECAREIGVPRTTLCDHLALLRRGEKPARAKTIGVGIQDRIALSRPPLPAGAPESWDLLTAGTCLAGEPYPVEIPR